MDHHILLVGMAFIIFVTVSWAGRKTRVSELHGRGQTSQQTEPYAAEHAILWL